MSELRELNFVSLTMSIGSKPVAGVRHIYCDFYSWFRDLDSPNSIYLENSIKIKKMIKDNDIILCQFDSVNCGENLKTVEQSLCKFLAERACFLLKTTISDLLNSQNRNISFQYLFLINFL